VSTRIKICGLTRADDMRLAIDEGADYVGLVFADGSPRRVDESGLDEWLESARDGAEVVGVFRDQSLSRVLEIVEHFDLDFVQLHGTEAGDAWKQLPVRLIESRIVGEGVPAARFAGAAWAQLLDAGAGSGTSFDWSLAVELARAERVFLAGGLDPQTVGDAVRQVRPFAVDVASGTESAPGIKDPERVRAFIQAVRSAATPAPPSGEEST